MKCIKKEFIHLYSLKSSIIYEEQMVNQIKNGIYYHFIEREGETVCIPIKIEHLKEHVINLCAPIITISYTVRNQLKRLNPFEYDLIIKYSKERLEEYKNEICYTFAMALCYLINFSESAEYRKLGNLFWNHIIKKYK